VTLCCAAGGGAVCVVGVGGGGGGGGGRTVPTVYSHGTNRLLGSPHLSGTS